MEGEGEEQKHVCGRTSGNSTRSNIEQGEKKLINKIPKKH